ncbi:uncharacterized protein KY384_001666 [Bacidia gigantensis]|uniref:uncharacterized protein n=1 Tax=Bacidia gigantensis TaxID=2732470 RepID=UPI001D045C19|nr:uncharacterized protein KY384_001666 [Bacidia gigantensis]KAG8533925.1 hypothetical protein KY384_001666 [Bacidia gigantensis]
MAPILSTLNTNYAPSLYDHSIDYRLGFEPAECSYIEISPDPSGASTIREGFLYPDQVEEWLFPGPPSLVIRMANVLKLLNKTSLKANSDDLCYYLSSNYLAPQPMFVPVMLMHLLLIMTMTRMQHQGQRLDSTQHSLGQHTYSSKPREDPFRADFETITPALNGTARTLSMMEMRTQARQVVLEKCLTYIEANARDAPPEIVSLLDKSRDAILQHLEMTMNSNHNLLLQAAFEQKRIQIQLAVIYHFSQQKSNQIAIALTSESTGIAEHSRQDAAALKTIAVLTMAFLPGTFIAALFTTPFFDWEVPKRHSVIKERFWYYWVTTTLLTFGVFLTWVLWQQWQGRIRKRMSTDTNAFCKKTV